MSRRMTLALAVILLATVSVTSLLLTTSRGQGLLRRAGISPPRMAVPAYRRAVAAQRAANTQLPPDCVLFGGNSLTLLFPAQMLSERGWVGRGLSGDRVDDLAARLEPSVLSAPCRIVAVLIGSNDIVIDRRPAAHVAAGIAEIVDRLVAAGRIVLVATLPPTRGGFADARDALVEVNALLYYQRWPSGVELVDLYAALATPDGLLAERFSMDGLHLSEEGYRVFASVFEAQLAKVRSRVEISR